MGKHAIIVIKNKIDNYLQYFDCRWNSYLFFNCKVENENEDFIKNIVSEKFSVSIDDIDCRYVGKKIHSKYSESHKEIREYEHYFFDVKFSNYNNMSDNEFIINDLNCKWFSYNELLNDKRIQEVNSDIVSFIKEFNI